MGARNTPRPAPCGPYRVGVICPRLLGPTPTAITCSRRAVVSAMIVRVIPVLLLFTSLAIGAVPLHAQKAVLEKRKSCKRQVVRPPSQVTSKAGALNSARERVVERARARVAHRAAEAGISQPKGIFVLRSDKGGTVVKLAAARTNIPEPMLEDVATEMVDLFAGWPERGAASVFVRLDSIVLPEVPVGAARITCVPDVLNELEITRALEHHAQERPRLMTKHVNRTIVRFVVSREGNVLAPELETPSGNSQWDQIALSIASELLFAPAQMDGVPVDTWLSMPFFVKGAEK